MCAQHKTLADAIAAVTSADGTSLVADVPHDAALMLCLLMRVEEWQHSHPSCTDDKLVRLRLIQEAELLDHLLKENAAAYAATMSTAGEAFQPKQASASNPVFTCAAAAASMLLLQ